MNTLSTTPPFKAILPTSRNSVPLCGDRMSQSPQEADLMSIWTESERERKAAAERGETVLANLKADKHLIEWAKESGIYVFIGRPGKWRNPYVIGKHGDRQAVLEQFKNYFAEKPELHERLPDLQGKVLGCYCFPESCHGHQLIAAVHSCCKGEEVEAA